MRVLVTGATGFLGPALVAALSARGDEVTALSSAQADLTLAGSLTPYSQTAYDQIFHLATWTQAGDFCLRHPGEQWIINQQITTNVLTWWHTAQPQAKFISLGSSCSYPVELDLVETNYLTGMPIDSLFTFAMTKRMLHTGQMAFHKQFGHRYLTLVPATLYGPGYHTDGRQLHFIFDLIRKIIRGKLFGETVVLWGDGYQQRELIWRDDFVKIALQLADTCDNTLINVGAGREDTIRHFAQLICERVGYDFGAIQFDTTRYTGATSKRLNVERLNALLPDLHWTPLADGLAHTIDWALAQQAVTTVQP